MRSTRTKGALEAMYVPIISSQVTVGAEGGGGAGHEGTCNLPLLH